MLYFKSENKQACAYLVSDMDKKTKAGMNSYKRVLDHRKAPHSEGNFKTIMLAKYSSGNFVPRTS